MSGKFIKLEKDFKNGYNRKKENDNIIEGQENMVAEIPKVMEGLSLVERGFLQRYISTGDADKSFRDTLDSLKLYYPQKREVRKVLIDNMLMKAAVKNAEKELRGLLISEANNHFAEAGVSVSKKFSELAKDYESLDRMNKRIERYDMLIAQAVANGDSQLERALMNEQLAFEKKKDKLIESVRKNASLVNEIVGDSKQKQVIKAGSININVGEVNNGPKTITPTGVPTLEMINIEELE